MIAPLKIPFSWKERYPYLDRHFFLIPNHYSEHKFIFGEEKEQIFFNPSHKICMEFCSGNGSWIIEKARLNEAILWLAVELRFDRARAIWSKMQKLGLRNLLVVYGEAGTFVQHYVPDALTDEIFINFPDPWPKRRHAKNRLMRSDFMQQLSRILKKNGTITFVTDDPSYSEQTIQDTLRGGEWESVLPFPFYQTDWVDYGTSYFESLWKSKGLAIRYHRFRKKAIGAEGFEPPTHCSQSSCASQTALCSDCVR
jgi:tRNA (guanine-N7-)-methyltransferase